MATDNVRVLKVDTGEAQTSVKDLRKELKQLKDALLNAEEGTQEYNDALQRAAGIQHQLKEQMEEVNASAMDFGQIAGNVVKATGGLVAGFQAAQATMNLFGVENENVIKAMQKMQSLMAITQAIPAIDDGIKGFKRLQLAVKGASMGMSGFRKALISTGLGALVVVLGSIIANWDEFTKAIGLSEEKMQKLGEIWGGVQNVLLKGVKGVGLAIVRYIGFIKDSVTGVFGGLGDALKALFSGDFGGVKSALKGIASDFTASFHKATDGMSEYFDVAANYAEGVQNAITKREQEAAEERAEAQKKELDEKNKRYQEYVNKRKEQLSTELSLEEAKHKEGWKYTDEGKKYYDNYYKKLLKLYAKDSNDYKQVLTQKLNYEKDYNNHLEQEAMSAYELRLAKIDNEKREAMLSLLSQELAYEDYVKRKEELEDEFKKKRIEAIQNILATETHLSEESIKSLKDELISLQDSLYKKPAEEPESEEVSKAKQISEAINASALALTDFSDNPAWGNILKNVATLTANWDTLSENMKKVNSDIPGEAEKAYSAYAQIAAAGLGAVAQMMNGLAAEQDTSNKEGFESAKKYQIAGATMSMLAGIASAWASSMQLMFPANVIIGSLLSAMMLGTGIAQIVKIKNTKFDSKGSASAGATPNAGAVASVIAPVQYTQDVQGANIEGAIKNQKVYVTETDITDTQDKVSVTENEAKY